MARIIMLLVLIAILIFNVRSLSREENEKYLQLKKEFKTLTEEEYLKLRRQVKRLNKPAVKTFQTEYGDIFDCVDIYKQPGLDHPLMKNHTVKLRPSFYTKEMESQHRNEFNKSDCPPLTVPIRRTKIHDLLVIKFVTKSLSDWRSKQIGHERHYATAQVLDMQDKMYGAQVDMNVWKPKLADNWQFSLAQLWIVNGNRETRNTVEVGWHVFPFLYNDTEPRTFVYWTADGYNNTGCYNLDYVGFVLVHSTNTLIGKPIVPFSQYNGDQHDITIEVQKDPLLGDWWLIFGGGDSVTVGYWSNTIFTNFPLGGSELAYSGEVFTLEGRKKPEMGSGHFPGWFQTAAYMRRMMYLRDDLILGHIPDHPSLYQDLTDCYRVVDYGDQGPNWSKTIYFGGPGGC